MKTSTKEPSILELVKDQYPTLNPTDLEKKVVENTFHKFRYSADQRNRNYQYFDGLNLIEYINDSVRRFTTNIDERDSLEDWQARVHDPFTRNKVLAILGRVSANLPIAQFKSKGDDDPRKGILLTNLYEYVEDKEEYEEVMSQLLLEAIVKGTAIGYEGVTRKTNKHRDITGVGDDMTISESTETETLFPTTVVPLEDFYPSSVSIRTIAKMPYCFWRTVQTYSEFMADWKGYDKTKYVVPKFNMVGSMESETKPFYFDHVSQDVSDGQVELIKYYNVETDEFIIIANGIWLNPVTIKGQEDISPIPFNHKKLPFFEIKFDFFGDWFYGKSLPDRLKSMQDVLNVLTNMLLDQSFLTIFPPLLTNGSDSVEDDYLRPGRRTPIDTQGQPLSESFMKLDLGVPSSWHQYILEYTKRIMEQSSLDQVSSGQAGVGGRTTAQEINTAASAVSNVLGIFGMLIKYGIKQKAALKGANILQFGTDEKTPLVSKIMGSEAGQISKYFNVFKLDDTMLSDGKHGVKMIEMYGDKKDMPTKSKLEARQIVTSSNLRKPVEIVAITAEHIRSFDFMVSVVENPKSDQTKDMAKALQLEKVKTYLSFFPSIVDVNELAIQTAMLMGDDPTKIIKQEVLNPQPTNPADNPAALSPTSTEPQGNAAQSAVQGMQGGNLDNLNILLKGGV